MEFIHTLRYTPLLIAIIRTVLLNNPSLYFSARELFSIALRYKWNIGLPTTHRTSAFTSPRQHPQCGRNLWLDVQTYNSPDSENLYKSTVAILKRSIHRLVWNSIRLWKKKEIIIFTCGWIRSKKDCRNACSTWLDFMKCLMVPHLLPIAFLFLSPRILYTCIFVSCISGILFCSFWTIPVYAFASLWYGYYFYKSRSLKSNSITNIIVQIVVIM